jgi:hypothetical protein
VCVDDFLDQIGEFTVSLLIVNTIALFLIIHHNFDQFLQFIGERSLVRFFNRTQHLLDNLSDFLGKDWVMNLWHVEFEVFVHLHHLERFVLFSPEFRVVVINLVIEWFVTIFRCFINDHLDLIEQNMEEIHSSSI